mgnify:CR=1 FL=1
MDKMPEDIVYYVSEFSLNESIFALSKVSREYAKYASVITFKLQRI